MKLHSITDQIAHFIVALGLLALFAQGCLIAGAAAGLGMGLIRETAEGGGSRMTVAEIKAHFKKRGAWIDLVFWSLGGLTAAALVG